MDQIATLISELKNDTISSLGHLKESHRFWNALSQTILDNQNVSRSIESVDGPLAIGNVVKSDLYEEALGFLRNRAQQWVQSSDPKDLYVLKNNLEGEFELFDKYECCCPSAGPSFLSGTLEPHFECAQEQKTGSSSSDSVTIGAASPPKRSDSPIDRANEADFHTKLCSFEGFNTFSDSESLYSTDHNPDNMPIMDQDHMYRIAKSLDPEKSSQSDRRNALRQLLHMPIIDIQACEAWDSGEQQSGRFPSERNAIQPRDSKKDMRNRKFKLEKPFSLRNGLHAALSDKDDIIWNLALRYICKGLSTTPSNIRESYLLLTERLLHTFTVRLNSLPTITEKVDFATQPVNRLVRELHILNRFQRIVPVYWSRYSQKFLNEMMEEFFKLFSIGCEANWNLTDSSRRRHIFPLVFLSLLDTQADWFRKWMLGLNARNLILTHMKKHSAFLQFQIHHFTQFLRSSIEKSAISEATKSAIGPHADPSVQCGVTCYHPAEIQFAMFVHASKVITLLLSYEHGRELLINLNDGNTSLINDLISQQLTYIYESKDCLDTREVSESLLQQLLVLVESPAVVTSCFLNSMPSSTKCNEAITGFTSTELLFRGWENLATSKDFTDEALWSFGLQLRLLDRITEYTPSRILFSRVLQNNAENNDISNPSSLLFSISARVLFALNGLEAPFVDNTYSNKLFVLLEQLIKISGKICDDFWTVNEYDRYCELVLNTKRKLAPITTFFRSLEYSTDLDKSINVKVIKADLCCSLPLEYFRLLNTNRGIFKIIRTEDSLLDSAKHLRYFLQSDKSLLNPRDLASKINRLATMPQGFSALVDSGIWSSCIEDIWTTITSDDMNEQRMPAQCDFDSSYPTIAGFEWSTDSISRYTYKHFARLIKLTGVYKAISLSKRTARVLSDSLYKLLRFCVFEVPEKSEYDLHRTEELQLFGLRLLSCLVCDLDFLLNLDADLNLIEHLLVQQTSCPRTEHNCIIIDVVLMERNQLLVRVSMIGGPNERILPPRSIAEYQSEGFELSPFVESLSPTEMLRYDLIASERKKRFQLVSAPFSTENLDCGHLEYQSVFSFLYKEFIAHECSRVACEDDSVNWLNSLRTELCESLIVKELKHCTLNIEYSADRLCEFLLKLLDKNIEGEKSNFGLNRLSTGGVVCPDGSRYTEREKYGARLVINYGIRLGLFEDEDSHFHTLLHLLDTVRNILIPSKQNSADEDKNGACHFDWFVSTLFLMFRGRSDLTLRFLVSFAADVRSIYLWRNRAESLVRSAQLQCDPFLYNQCHLLEKLLETECSSVYNAFQLVGFTPTQIFIRWTNQCFMNYLDWWNIIDYLLICLFYPLSYSLLFGITIFKHLEEKIVAGLCEKPTLQQHQPDSFIITLQEEPIRDFTVIESLSYMKKLYEKYGTQLDRYLCSKME